MLFRFWVFPDCTFLDISILGHGALRISARAFEEEVTEAEGQISDLIERWNVRDFDLRRVRATATIIDKKEEKGS